MVTISGLRAPAVQCICLATLAASRQAGATKPEPPPVGALAVQLGKDDGSLSLTAASDLRDVVVEIYGLDGLRVGTSQDDLVWVRFGAVGREQTLTIPFSFARGEGQTELVVFARAAGRMSRLTRVIGDLSAEQRRRRGACVRRDPDGGYVKIMGCDEEGPAPATPRPRAVQSALVTSAPPDLAADATVRMDGPLVQLSPARPVFQEPGCRRTEILDGRLRREDDKERVEWRVYGDDRCAAPVTVMVTVERPR